jgi:hypothetical protein
MKEIWKNIEGYDGYKISNFGNCIGISGKLLKNRDNGNGYHYLCLYKNKKPKYIGLHRVVAYSFLRESGKNLVVNHIDGNKKNNTISNLELVTQNQNAQHTKKLGRTTFGTKNSICKLKEDDVIYIRNNYKKSLTGNASGGGNLHQLAKDFNVSPSSILNIIQLKTWNYLKI